MNNQLLQFTNELFGNVRTIIDEQGNSWFVGRDVAICLGYERASKAIQDHVYEEDKAEVPIRDISSTQSRNMYIINESGLYSLIFSSQLPKAREFKHWVTSEILPTMRKIGFQESENLLRNELVRLQDDNNRLQQEVCNLHIDLAYKTSETVCTTAWVIYNKELSPTQKINAMKFDPGEEFAFEKMKQDIRNIKDGIEYYPNMY